MNQKHRNLWLIVAIAVALLLPVNPLAAADQGIVAEVENSGSKLVFYPVVEFKELIFTVTGPCNYDYRQVVRRGDNPVFRLDETTIDGYYTYDLVVIPEVEDEIIQVLKKARLLGDNREVDQLCRDGKLPGDPASQSHGFTVSRNKIVWEPGSTEGFAEGGDFDIAMKGREAGGGIPLKDFVINDDLIVDGSACIGFDCVNGESFGFDTIRIKENNLRIKFDDTSVAASFPRNDWQLTANDSANGGASKFSIDDISGNRTPFTVEANARSHSLYVDDGGRIGSRTSTPSVEIHTIDGDTPTLRLQQDGSSGFAPQTWDVAGNETNFFVRDVTNGSALPFRIRPGAPTSSIFIDEDGNVGIGSSSPDQEIHIVSTSTDNAAVQLETAGGDWIFRSQSNGQFQIRDNANATIPMRLHPGADPNLLNIGVEADGSTAAAGEVNVTGVLAITGSVEVDGGVVHADYVFEPGYDLPSIEENSTLMWAEKHLPALPKAPVGLTGPVNLVSHQMGMLEELEKAHIYIDQLNERLAKQDNRLEELEALILALTKQ